MIPTTSPGKGKAREQGQVLIIFAVAFAIIIMMLALLFDGARAVVLRRQYQDASDAAALAAANVLQSLSPKGCSATAGPPPGSPQAAIVAAAKASVQTNLPGYDLSKVTVTCVNGMYLNSEVQVSLLSNSPSFFGGIFGGGNLSVATTTSAVNGAGTAANFNVVLLNPSGIAADNYAEYSWPNGRQGCPSFGINGGITAIFDSTIYIDSACDQAHGGAFAPNGGSATLTFTTQTMHIVGEYNPGALTVTPAPLIHQKYKDDPYAGLTPPPVTNTSPCPTPNATTGCMQLRSSTKLSINGGQTAAQCIAKGLTGGSNQGCILQPGVYVGGIELKSSAVVYLRPGIYVLKDGGLSLGAQSKLFSINAGSTGATESDWAGTNCLAASCGVLIYKTTVTSTDQISITAGATFMVRAFNPDADTTVFQTGTTYDREQLRHLLIWQDANPVPTSSYIQPTIQLQGGGNVVMSGGVYAPSAPVDLHGTSGGSSGNSVDLSLQFIVWDMSLSGNSNFHFQYNAADFPTTLDYGLTR